jgi:GT2 family glycosyltransferase
MQTAHLPGYSQMHRVVYIIIVNWNGWQDTLECLESVFRSDYPHYRVIVCDNGSTDDSLEMIKSWAEGTFKTPIPSSEELNHLTHPPTAKPIDLAVFSRSVAEAGGGDENPPLLLIRNDTNLGFAGGNNVGLRYALSRDDFAYAWLLNNDTVVTPGALSALVRRMEEKPGAGMCGSTLLYYDHPAISQGLGGAVYNRWTGTNRHIGVLQPFDPCRAVDEVERKMDYVIGASMFVSKTMIKDTGLMCEDYFLYFEELDWALRARGQYTLAYAADSIVYHKEGRSAGTSFDVAQRGRQFDYYLTRNKLLVTRRFFPTALPTVCLGLIWTCFNRLRRGQCSQIRVIADAIQAALHG